MEKATLAFLRQLAFWKAAEKLGLDGGHPAIREIDGILGRDFVKKFQVVKLSEVN